MPTQDSVQLVKPAPSVQLYPKSVAVAAGLGIAAGMLTGATGRAFIGAWTGFEKGFLDETSMQAVGAVLSWMTVGAIVGAIVVPIVWMTFAALVEWLAWSPPQVVTDAFESLLLFSLCIVVLILPLLSPLILAVSGNLTSGLLMMPIAGIGIGLFLALLDVQRGEIQKHAEGPIATRTSSRTVATGSRPIFGPGGRMGGF